MMSRTLMLYCLLTAGAYLLSASILLQLIGGGLRITRGIPANMLESTNRLWLASSFAMEFLFFVFIPTLGYGFLNVVLPLAGLRPGLAVALLVFTLGVAPTCMGLAMRLKISMPFLLYFTLGLLLKLGGTLGIIAWLHTL